MENGKGKMCISEMTRKQMRGRWHLDGFKILGIDRWDKSVWPNNPSVLKPWLFGWQWCVSTCRVSFLPGEHLFLLGSPGTAKSLLARRLSKVRRLKPDRWVVVVYLEDDARTCRWLIESPPPFRNAMEFGHVEGVLKRNPTELWDFLVFMVINHLQVLGWSSE